LMNKLIAERDWSAQEVMAHLLNIPAQESSRVVINVDCRPEQDQPQAIAIADGSIQAGISSFVKYKNRDMRPRAPPRILNFWPRYKPSIQLEDYCRVKMMLHHPFNMLDNLKWGYDTWKEAYDECRNSCPEHDKDTLDDLLAEAQDNDEFENEEQEETQFSAGFEDLAAQRPGDDRTRIEDPDLLGHRNLDRAYDWNQHCGNHSDIDLEFWKNKKAEVGTLVEDEQPFSQSIVDDLNAKQLTVYTTVIQQYERILADEDPSQLLLNIDGAAGSGKSHLIHAISSSLK
ncbi:hypothetical protein K402DRAFT_304358, partial [Aulographum hederae CBS 113979]